MENSYLQKNQSERFAALFQRSALWIRENEVAGKPPQYWLCFGESAERSRGLTKLQRLFPGTYQWSNRLADGRRYFFIDLPEKIGETLKVTAPENRIIDTSRETTQRRMIGKEAREEAAIKLEELLKEPREIAL